MTVGVCYFPEHWPRERWPTDVEEMAGAGIEYVRMGEFAWSWVTDFAPAPVQVHADAEWVVGDGTVQGYDAGVVAAPPHELTVERAG